MCTPRLSFPDYLKGDTHSNWSAAAPPRDIISLRAAIRRDTDLLGEERTPWLRDFAASAQCSGNPEDLLEAAVYYCALEEVRPNVPGKRFVSPAPAAPRPTPTEQTITELLRQMQAQGSALENLTKKLEAVGVHGKTRDEQIPTLCWAEFENLVAIQSKPQWVVRALDMFHGALMGVSPIPSEARCTRDWSTLAQGIFPAPEGALGSTDQWVPSAPATNEGEEPMTNMSSSFAVMYFSQVEALWAIVTSVLKIYLTQFRGGDVGPALDTDVLQSAQVNFGDTSVPRDEILRRVQAMASKFEVRNGRLLYKLKGGERLDVTDPPATACKSCRKQGQGGKCHWFVACPQFE